MAIIAGVLLTSVGLIHYRRTRDDFEAVRFEPAGFVIDLTGILTALFGGISDSYRAANVKIWVCHPRDYDDRAVRAEHGSARQSLLPHSLYQETRLQVFAFTAYLLASRSSACWRKRRQ
jgi:hypothetical protein